MALCDRLEAQQAERGRRRQAVEHDKVAELCVQLVLLAAFDVGLADATQLRTRVLRHFRQSGKHRIFLRMTLHEALHECVFERMKADRYEAPVRL